MPLGTQANWPQDAVQSADGLEVIPDDSNQPSAHLVEQRRVEALSGFGILDTAVESAFDDLTTLAAALCQTPMALVSLVDADRQWFKSHLGLAICETTREVSFCSHALTSSAPLIVTDTHADERFRTNELVTGEPWIRFYAGIPLVTADGHGLGTLCVLDVVPRTLSHVQVDLLTKLAGQVMSQLELRRQAHVLAAQIAARVGAEAGLRRNRRLVQDILDNTDVLIFAHDTEGQLLLGNPTLHPTTEQLDPAPGGVVRRFQSTNFPLRDESGAVYAIASVSTDITELALERAARLQSEQRWRALVEHSPVAVAVIGADTRFAYANPQALALYGVERLADLLDCKALAFVPAGDEPATRDLFTELMAGGEPLLGRRWTLLRRDGVSTLVEINAARVTYGGAPAVQVELRDVSEQMAAENALRDSERRFRALFDRSPVGTAECSPDGTVVAVNALLCEMLGYSAAELIGTPAGRLLADPEESVVQQRDLASLQTATTYQAERVYRRKDGTTFPVLVGVAAVRDEVGAVQRVLGTVVDLTERAAAQSALQAAHDQLAEREAFTAAVLDSIDVGIVACDSDGHLTLFNHAAQAWHGIDLAGCPDGAAASERFSDTFDLYNAAGETLANDEIPLLIALTQGSVRGAEILISPHGLPATRVVCSGRALTGPDGRKLGAVVALTDITGTRAQTRALQASERRFKTTFINDPAGLALLSRTGKALQVNPALCNLLGRGEGELLALPDLLALALPSFAKALTDLAERAATEPGATITREQVLVATDGSERWLLVTLTDLPDENDDSRLLLQCEDISARHQAVQQLTHQAMHDHLTDLPNRATLLDRTTTALARMARRPAEGAVAMLFCDLDGFKEVNDEHGHEAGDHLLVTIAGRLQHMMRPTDTVARLGGDEFVVVCEGLRDADEGSQIATRLMQAFAEPVVFGRAVLQVTTSIGIAFGSPETTADDLLRNSDVAMYQAKRFGKNQHQVFGPLQAAERVTHP